MSPKKKSEKSDQSEEKPKPRKTRKKKAKVEEVEAETSTHIELPAEAAESIEEVDSKPKEPRHKPKLAKPPGSAPAPKREKSPHVVVRRGPKLEKPPVQCQEFCDLYEKFGVTDVTFAGMTGVSVDAIQRWKRVARAPKSIIDLLKHKVAQKK